jgi:hypothetical protein
MRNGIPLLLALAVALAAWAQPALPDDPAAARAELIKQGFTPIFDGKSLDGWDVKEGHDGHWVARDGIIDYDGKAESKARVDKDLWTKAEWGDFVLHAEWRFPATPTMKPHPIVLPNGDFDLDENGKRKTVPRLDAGDSGIYVRGVMDAQINIWSQWLGSGEINVYRKNKSLPDELRKKYFPTTRADKPFGEWNRFLVTMRGDRMTIVLNGETVLDNVPLPGVPSRGAIGLQHHGDPIQFRNLMIKSLD